MRRRPLLLWLVGVWLLLSPLYYFFERVVLSHLDWTDPLLVLRSLDHLKLLMAGIGPVVGALVLWMRPVSWYAMLGYSVFAMAANVALLVQHRMGLGMFALFMPTGLLCLLYFVRRQIMDPYFNPRLRWWSSDRVRLRRRADLQLGDALVETETWDISASGVFLATDRPIPVGESLEITLHLDDAELQLRALSVWASERGDGDRPAGVGARFDETSSLAVAAMLRQLRQADAGRQV